MATPGTPANFSVKQGPHPNSIYVNADTVSASPTVTIYNVYVQGATGVNKSAGNFTVKKSAGVPDILVTGIPEAANHFVTITAESSEAESNIATEINFRPRR